MEFYEGQHKEKQQPYIVFDHNISEFWQNRILNRSYMSQFPGAFSLAGWDRKHGVFKPL